MSVMVSEEFIIKSIHDAIKRHIEREIAAVVETAKHEVEQRINAQADMLALEMLAEYSVQRIGPEIIITVRKI